MNNFSFLYHFFRPIVFTALRVYYSKVQYVNKKWLPAKGPVLVCASHTNAFIDPLLIQTGYTRQIYNLARGDVFNNKFLAWLFGKFRILPIFRKSEGTVNLHKNEESFLRSYQVLESKTPLVIYPEGLCVQEKRLRKLKKGAARIAFGIEERNGFNFNLTILPICINYSNPSKFRSTVLLYFTNPLYTKDYVALYKQDKAKAIKKLTDDIEQEMANVYLHINNKNLDVFVEQIFEICKPYLFNKLKLNAGNLADDFELNRKIINAVNTQEKKDARVIDTLKAKVEAFDNKVKNTYKLRHHLFAARSLKSINAISLCLQIIGIVIGFPFYVLGLITNYLPYKMAYVLAKKLVKKNIEFYSSVNMVIGLFAWLIYYTLQLIVVKLLFNDWSLFLVAVMTIPALGMYAINYYWFLRKLIGSTRLFFLRLKKQTQFDMLLKERTEIIKELDGMMVL